MLTRRFSHITIFLVAGLLAGCAKKDEAPRLNNLAANQTSPDEFLVLPTKPLEMPGDYAALPTPTPGGDNLADPTPHEDAVAALGGNPDALDRRGIPAADGALLAQVTRYGTAEDIRETLAAEDLEFRRGKRGRPLERIFNVNVYFRAYKDFVLDPYAELERFRRLGVRTPTAPPSDTQ